MKPHTHKAASPKHARQLLMALEPRVMFDAALVSTAETAVAADAGKTVDASKTAPATDAGKDTGTAKVLGTTDGKLLPGVVRDVASAKEVVFIEANIANVQQMVAAVPTGMDVVLLDPTKDGVQQITTFLASHTGLSAVHIVSHGEAGEILMGATTLSEATLSQYADQLQAWHQYLAADADLLIYGCDVAQGSSGQSFIADLVHLTGTSVAASTDLTGAADYGANWVLESQAGSIETKSLDLGTTGWDGDLGGSTTWAYTASGALFFNHSYQLHSGTSTYSGFTSNTSTGNGSTLGASYFNTSTFLFTPKSGDTASYNTATGYGNNVFGSIKFSGSYYDTAGTLHSGTFTLQGEITGRSNAGNTDLAVYFYTVGNTTSSDNGIAFALVMPGQSLTASSSFSVNSAGVSTALDTLQQTEFGTSTTITATADTGSLNAGATLTKTAGTGVLSNDTDTTTGLTLTVTGVVAGTGTPSGNVGSSLAGTYGHLTLNSDGSYSYVADTTSASNLTTGTSATDTFTYQVSDGVSGAKTTTLTVTVNGTATATAPAETVTISTMTKDTGAADFITSDGSASRTVTGSLSASLGTNEALKVSFDGGSTWTTASVTGTSWTVTDSSSHSGNWTIQAKVVNTSTNLSGTAASQSVTLDTTADAAPSLTLNNDSDPGPSDAYTNATPSVKVTLNGTGSTAPVAGDVVNVYSSGSSVGTATLTSTDITNGYVNITTSSLGADGAKSLTATVTDKAGNVSSASTALALTVDTTAPAISSATVSGNTLTLTYTENGSGLYTAATDTNDFTVKFGTNTVAVNSVVVNATNKTVTLTLASAAVSSDTVTVAYTNSGTQNTEDMAGNLAASFSARSVTNATGQVIPSATVSIASMTKDTGAADFVTNDGSSGRTVSGSYTGTLGTNEVVEVSFDGGTTWVTATLNGSNWTATDSGAHTGNWTIEARVTNSVTHVSGTPASQAVTLDTTADAAPTLSLNNDSDPGPSDTYTGATPSVRVTLNGSGATAPVAGDVVKLYSGATEVGSVTLSAGDITAGHVDITTSNLGADGAKSLTATVTDGQGNVSPASNTLGLTVDTTAPLLASAAVNGATLTLTYTEAGSGLHAATATDAGDFSVSVNGQTVAVSNVTMDATSKTVTLTLAQAAVTGDAVQVSYQPAVAVPATEDVAGNLAAAFSNHSVTNNTPAVVSAAPTETLTIGAMTKDTGTSATDFVTGDGSAGRSVTGTVSSALGTNEIIEVSFDGGNTWVTAAVNGTNWSATDNGAHTGDWTITARVTNTASHQSGTAATQAVTLEAVPPVAPLPPPTLVAPKTVVPETPPSSGPSVAPHVPLPPLVPQEVSKTDPLVDPAQDTASLKPLSETAPSSSSGGSFLVAANKDAGSADAPSNLMVVKQPPTVEAETGKETNLQLPSGIFQNTDSSAKVDVKATLADGSPLPSWMHFDPSTGRFTGTAPKGSEGTMDIKLTAQDDRGNAASTQFAIRLGDTDSQSSNNGSGTNTGTTSSVETTPAKRDGVSSAQDGNASLTTGLVFRLPESIGNEQGLSLALRVSDQDAALGRDFAFQLPNGLFRHTDPAMQVSVEARLADGSPLPSWLSFNPETGKFTGKVPVNLDGNVEVRIIARDATGKEVSAQFHINVADLDQAQRATAPRADAGAEKDVQPAKRLSVVGRPALNEQMARHGKAGLERDQQRLVSSLHKLAQARRA